MSHEEIFPLHELLHADIPNEDARNAATQNQAFNKNLVRQSYAWV
jgi:hypothetical protein